MEKPYSLSVKVVILDGEGRCLLLKRSTSSRSNAGKWEFPGGKIDAGETFDAALIREVHEETGLTIGLERVAGSAESALPDRKIAYIIMEGKFQSGEVMLSSEHDDYRWVNKNGLLVVNLAEQFVEFARQYGRREG